MSPCHGTWSHKCGWTTGPTVPNIPSHFTMYLLPMATPTTGAGDKAGVAHHYCASSRTSITSRTNPYHSSPGEGLLPREMVLDLMVQSRTVNPVTLAATWPHEENTFTFLFHHIIGRKEESRATTALQGDNPRQRERETFYQKPHPPTLCWPPWGSHTLSRDFAF